MRHRIKGRKLGRSTSHRAATLRSLATALVKHKKITSLNSQILFAYAHIIPQKGLKSGQRIRKNEVLATICKNSKNPQLPPHLHFSCFEIPKNIRPEHLNWDLFSKSPDINLINPVFL